jgi:LuxR family quorum-sensing system transcriptional regulator CciR
MVDLTSSGDESGGGRRMTELSDLNCFIEASRGVDDDSALAALLGDFARELSFDGFSLFRGSSDGSPSIAITDYPEIWLERVISRRYHGDDPVYHAARRTAVGFRRDQIGEHLALTDRQRTILVESERAGLADWYAVPAHVSGETCGVSTFFVRTGRELPVARLPFAQLAGAFGFEAARRLRRDARGSAGPVPLTPRQVECLLLIARGKTDWEIGAILGLAEDTVGKYVNAARDRYGVSRRSQLVVRALYDGHFSLSEAVH